jgi:hypothetical protein
VTVTSSVRCALTLIPLVRRGPVAASRGRGCRPHDEPIARRGGPHPAHKLTTARRSTRDSRGGRARGPRRRRPRPSAMPADRGSTACRGPT